MKYVSIAYWEKGLGSMKSLTSIKLATFNLYTTCRTNPKNHRQLGFSFDVVAKSFDRYLS
jgi:hypothetical protein